MNTRKTYHKYELEAAKLIFFRRSKFSETVGLRVLVNKESAYALAKELGISKQAVSQCQKKVEERIAKARHIQELFCNNQELFCHNQEHGMLVYHIGSELLFKRGDSIALSAAKDVLIAGEPITETAHRYGITHQSLTATIQRLKRWYRVALKVATILEQGDKELRV